VTIHNDQGIERLGAAIVTDADGAVVATVVGMTGESGDFSEWPSELGKGPPVADAIKSGDTTVLLVGYDERIMELAAEWESALD
jgi:hypothetical protein